MTDDDIRAFRPAAAAGARPPARRRRWWPWLLAGLLVTGLALAALTAQALLGLARHDGAGLHVQIGSADWGDWADWGRWGSAGGAGDGGPVVIDGLPLPPEVQAHGGLLLLGLPLALAAVFTVLAVVVPLAVLLGLLAAVVGVGVALLATAGVAALLLAPLWLPALLLWLLLRRRPAVA
ncbi:MAG: hypothetical protein KGI90_04975 [Burkholderiales bacterium]|nr:hypothetical protein [Burkholderiales bacterium]